MRKRIFRNIIIMTSVILIVSTAAVIAAVYKNSATERKTQIKSVANYLASGYETGGNEFLVSAGAKTEDRITLINQNGTVEYDNFKSEAQLGNHGDRPEVVQAIETGKGESTRASDTLSQDTYYFALKMFDGKVLRVASTLKSISKIVNSTAYVIVGIALFCFAVAAASAKFITNLIVKPINEINPDRPLEEDVYEELSPLLVKMDKQNAEIETQLSELSHRQKEFSDITNAMNEALVIFSQNKKVLIANESAKKLFLNYSLQGKGYLNICRNLNYIKAVQAAFLGKSTTVKTELNGKIYQMSVNPVKSESDFAAVLFAVDITDRENAEQMRREFSANVSHELKTPLTSIMGYAEIIMNGIAKKDDVPEFSEKIYSEAKRLLSLIEDIIELSRLDEGETKPEFENVNLYALSEKVLNELSDKGEKAKVKTCLVGDELSVKGIERTLHEMIYNLCDNAITYNKTDGKVTLSVFESDGKTVLSVKDTGIGIAPEHIDRVFERFYRVDKSHSKETGGTGLGLSIVKHGAILHNAQIKIESEEEKGTVISLVFSE